MMTLQLQFEQRTAFISTTCSTELVDKLTVSHLVKKYTAICGSRRFIIEELWRIAMEIIRQKSAEANRNSDKKE